MRYAMAMLALIFGIGGCGEGVSGAELEGTYEIVAREGGPCDGPLEADPPPADERYFELRLEESAGVPPLLAYYPCEAPGDCDGMNDLRRSFGPAGSSWAAGLATASETASGCVLRYRSRRAFPTDEGIEIIETVHQETDDSLMGMDECNELEANRRRDRMPCVSVEETQARRLDPVP